MVKNQHYVPQFLLRKFSAEDSYKKINLYNINNKKIIRGAPINSQSSKNFFYGADQAIEKKLSNLENESSKIINNIIDLKNDFKFNANDKDILKKFIFIQYMRTLKFNDELDNVSTQFKKKLGLLSKESKSNGEKGYNLALKGYKYIKDLKIEFVINRTNLEFYLGDHPVIAHNFFSKTCGLALKGQSFFMPISPQILLVIYDKKALNLKKQIFSAESIKIFNSLQIKNSYQNVYFKTTFDTSNLVEINTQFNLDSLENIVGFTVKNIEDVNLSFIALSYNGLKEKQKNIQLTKELLIEFSKQNQENLNFFELYKLHGEKIFEYSARGISRKKEQGGVTFESQIKLLNDLRAKRGKIILFK